MTDPITAIPCLTICQPYPDLILAGEKPVENRSWYTRHRGVVGIHAGTSKSWLTGPASPHLFGYFLGFAYLEAVKRKMATAGADLRYRQHKERLDWASDARLYDHLYDHPHSHGPFCFILRYPWRLQTPVKMRGRRQFWYPTADEAAQIRAVLPPTPEPPYAASLTVYP